MNIETEDLQVIVENIWHTQLGLDLVEDDGTAEMFFQRHSAAGVMTASVQISGSWRGAVHMYCPRSMVHRAATLMFAPSAGPLSQDDLRDTLGELTNMTAGNIKALLPGESYISLPVVVDGSNYDITLISGETMVESGFELDGQLMVVKILKHRG